jgi:hypothetical protein
MRVIKSGDKRAGTLLTPSPARRTSGFASLAVLASAVFFASLLLFLSLTTPKDAARRLKFWLGAETSEYPWGRTMAEGDEYLLGVGKADITGYVHCRNGRDMVKCSTVTNSNI